MGGWEEKILGVTKASLEAKIEGGGHATEIIWAVEVAGTWYLAVWNSHGDGYYLMSRRCYEQLCGNNWEPFGGYLLTPDRMVERYDRITQGGGYFA